MMRPVRSVVCLDRNDAIIESFGQSMHKPKLQLIPLLADRA